MPHYFCNVQLKSGAIANVGAPVATDAKIAADAYAARYDGRVVGGPFPATHCFVPVIKVVVGTDAVPNDNHQAYRQANYQSAPYGRDTETVLDPRERGTGSLDTPSFLPPQEAIDESTDDEDYTDKAAIVPDNTGKKLGGEVRIRTGTEGPERVTSTEINRIVSGAVKSAVDEMFDDWSRRYGFDRSLLINPCPDAELIGGPESFAGMPRRGGEMVANDALKRAYGPYIGAGYGDYSRPVAHSAAPESAEDFAKRNPAAAKIGFL